MQSECTVHGYIYINIKLELHVHFIRVNTRQKGTLLYYAAMDQRELSRLWAVA